MVEQLTSGPLRVVEAPGSVAVAYTGRLLAALGATVVKLGPSADIDASALDFGKQVLDLDIRAEADQAEVARWMAGADVVLRDAAVAVQPGPILATIPPFIDLLALHSGGFGNGLPPRVEDPQREHPLSLPEDAVSLLMGLVACCGVLHALLERDRGRPPAEVRVDAQRVVASCMFNHVAAHLTGDSTSRLAKDRPHARRPLVACADGFVTVMAGKPAHLRALLGCVGESAAPLLQRLDQGLPLASFRAEIDEKVETWAAGISKHEVSARLQAAHVPCEAVLTPDEVLASPQLAARGFWLQRPGADLRIPGAPFGPVHFGDGERQQPAIGSDLSARGAGALAGVRVIDFGWVFAAPIATRILAGLGAEVIRVEHERAPDSMRARPLAFAAVNGDKRSLRIDAKSEEGRLRLRALLASADVLVDNFAPGVMERLGLGWEVVREINPRLIMCSVSGMGQTGPFRHHVMFGQLGHAYSGLTSLIGYEGGPPRGTEDGGFWTDPVAGYAAAAALMAALRERAATGKGRRIDITLTEASTAMMVRPLLAAQRGDVWVPRGNRHSRFCPHDVYRCGPDGADNWLALTVTSEQEWRSLCALLFRPDLATDPALATVAGRQRHTEQLRTAIEDWTRRRTTEEAVAALRASGIAAEPSHTAASLLSDPRLRHAAGMFVEDSAAGGGVAIRAFPSWQVTGSTVRWGPAPDLGEFDRGAGSAYAAHQAAAGSGDKTESDVADVLREAGEAASTFVEALERGVRGFFDALTEDSDKRHP